jgi:MarR family transcriptional regulator, transcriptional regulator for hemolysin
VDTRSEAEIRADLSYLFDKASQVLTSRTTAALAELGITPRGYCVLAKAQPGTLTQGELAELALLDKTTMVVTVDQLEAAGLARRRPSATDRRARLVTTTEAGDELVERARAIIDEVYAQVLGALREPERDALLDAMVRLVGADGPLGAAVAAPASGRVQRPRATRASSQTGLVDS